MFARRTRQREVVLELVRSTMDHPSADWVYRQARRRLPKISLGTVYRNLKRLAAEGLIREVHAAGQGTRFDGNTGQHHHVRCLQCGRINDLPASVDTRREQAAARALNFRIVGHHVEIQGVCPGCQDSSIENNSHYIRQRPPSGLAQGAGRDP
ncbi:MAG TPA: transcriptional repressor [Vicinamibacteria bacterium]|nr:transcriptional repressor [Vicinamibacteria bacterium]